MALSLDWAPATVSPPEMRPPEAPVDLGESSGTGSESGCAEVKVVVSSSNGYCSILQVGTGSRPLNLSTSPASKWHFRTHHDSDTIILAKHPTPEHGADPSEEVAVQ
jgi:hypothetical protein